MRIFTWLTLSFGFSSFALAAPLRIDPKLVLERIISHGQEIHQQDADYKDEIADWFEARGVFDFNFCAEVAYSRTDLDPLTALAPEEQKQMDSKLCLSKKLPTGTLLSATYGRQSLDKVLSPFSQSTNSLPTSTEDTITFELQQDLWRNFFGETDRKNRQAGALRTKAAQLENLEDHESLALRALEAYWSAYSAKENLRTSMEIRERYKKVVDNVRSKSRLGYTRAGELVRAEAEYETQDQGVKNLSVLYLSSLDELLRIIGLNSDNEVELADPTPLPEKISGAQVAKPERITEAENLRVEASRIKMEATRADARADLKLIARQSYLGADGDPGTAFSDMNSRNHPAYYVGLQWNYALDSHAYRAKEVRAAADYERHQAEAIIAREKAINEVRAAARELSSSHQIAHSAVRTQALRERAVKELDRSYIQGRSDIQDVIQAYKDLLSAQSERLKTLAQFNLAVAKWQAAQDKLVPNAPN